MNHKPDIISAIAAILNDKTLFYVRNTKWKSVCIYRKEENHPIFWLCTIYTTPTTIQINKSPIDTLPIKQTKSIIVHLSDPEFKQKLIAAIQNTK